MSNLFNDNSRRGTYEIAPGLQMRDLYQVVYDRLEYTVAEHYDVDVLCQRVCVEVEKKLGIYPNIEESSHAI